MLSLKNSLFSQNIGETENLNMLLERPSFFHQNTARHFGMDVWLVFCSMFKLL